VDLFPPPRLSAPRGAGWLQGRVMLGASGGLLAGDAVVLALSYGTYHLFTSGAVSPTAAHFRTAGIGLLTAALVLPPLGAALGGGWAGRGVRGGGFWRAFLLSVLGQSLALTAGYLTAPTFWAIVPVQFATIAPGTSVGLRWGAPSPRGLDVTVLDSPPGPHGPGAVSLGAPRCLLEDGAG
jgi:hypothetical protein